MEVQKLYDFDEIEFEDITVSLVRLVKSIPDHEFFYKLNQINNLCFSRIDDLIYECPDDKYHFPRYQAYHTITKTYFTFICNKSSDQIFRKSKKNVFGYEENVKFLLNNQREVEYILHSSEQFPDFFVISLPENLVFPLQDYNLNSNEELYQIIQYYE